MKLYVFLYNDTIGTQQSVQFFLETRREVLNWFRFAPHSFLLVSNESLQTLTVMFQNNFPGSWFFLSEINGTTSNGILPQGYWDFINNPKSSGKWQ